MRPLGRLRIRADPAFLDLAHPGPFAAHGGARALSGVGLCGLRRIHAWCNPRRLRRHDPARELVRFFSDAFFFTRTGDQLSLENALVVLSRNRSGWFRRTKPNRLPLPGRGLAQGCDQFVVGPAPAPAGRPILQGAATKITVLPATENCPLAALAPQLEIASPASPISSVGIRFDPG